MCDVPDLDLVARPSGLWDSRAPLHNYILERRDLSRTTCFLTIGAYTLRKICTPPENQARSVEKLLSGIVVSGDAVANQAWVDYRRSFGKNRDGSARRPSAAQVADDAYPALQVIRELTVVRLSSLFESFAQCWALNMLLALREQHSSWTRSQRELVSRFHPAIAKGHVPGWPEIVAGFPMLREGLSSIPNMFTNRRKAGTATAPSSELESAFAAILFWRSYRNLAIHTSRMVTRRFYARFKPTYDAITFNMAHRPVFLPGRPLPMHDDFYSAMAAAQYRAAIWMNERLLEYSESRRGHPEAPAKPQTQYFEETPIAPPLLIAGDHEASWRWAFDAKYRVEQAHNRGWDINA